MSGPRIVDLMGVPGAVVRERPWNAPFDAAGFNAKTAAAILRERIPTIFVDEVLASCDEFTTESVLAPARNVLAPFPRQWLEGQVLGHNFGILVEAMPSLHGVPEGRLLDDLRARGLEKLPEHERRVLRMWGYKNKVGTRTVHGPEWRCSFVIVGDERRPFMAGNEGVSVVWNDFDPSTTVENYDEGWTPIAMATVVRTFELLNAHNVALVEAGRTNAHVPYQMRQRQKLAWITYRVLRLRDGEGHKPLALGGEGRGIAMHPARGHLKRYGVDGNGLHFGKYQRTVWCPAHLRGNPEHGVRIRDLSVPGG
jgi:hypothetical protein